MLERGHLSGGPLALFPAPGRLQHFLITILGRTMRDCLRILMPNLEYPPLGGGAAPVTRGLARALVARGHHVDVVTMGYRGLPAEENEDGVRLFRVPALRSRLELSHVHELATYVWSGLRKFRALARDNDYDLCHGHFLLPTGLIPYLLRDTTRCPPYVITAHGSDVPGFNPDRFTLLHRLTPPLLRRILRHAAGLIVPSAALEELILSQFGSHTPALSRIPNGVELDDFTPQPKEPSLLIATRLFERKGVQHVIEAMSRIPEHGYQLEIAGDGPQRAQLEQQARELRVPTSFHGWLPRRPLCRLFERSRIFVLASMSDNFPVSLLEAMAAGCAIVTTSAGGCPEVVGDTGLVVEPGDVGALRQALTDLIRQPARAEELGRRAAERVRDLFSWPAVASRHEAAYEAALRRIRTSGGVPAAV
jgi:glycosyltransferase involved in cell wall biosynthesis